MNVIHFTKATVEDLPPAAPGKRAYYYDDDVKGLQVAVTDRATKSYCVYRKVNGKPKRVVLGRHPDLTPAGARKAALKTLSHIAEGGDPIEEKRAERARGVTLNEAFKQFKKARPNLKEKTLYDYGRVIEVAFEDWQERPVTSFTKDKVSARHRKLGRERGEAYANLAMRVLRSILNFASIAYESADGAPLLPENPVKRLSQTRAWYRDKRRQTYIKPHELPAWFQAVDSLRGDERSPSAATIADYLEVLLLTGLRRTEALRLTWADVDLDDRTICIRETKNHEPHTLPLSDYLHAIFERRSQASESPWVFAGPDGESTLVEPRKCMARVTKRSGVDFTLHDLRRTFLTIAENLDIPAYALKRLVNHKMRGDVTAGYIQITTERLRGPMQQITEFILSAAEVRPSATVHALAASGGADD